MEAFLLNKVKEDIKNQDYGSASDTNKRLYDLTKESKYKIQVLRLLYRQKHYDEVFATCYQLLRDHGHEPRTSVFAHSFIVITTIKDTFICPEVPLMHILSKHFVYACILDPYMSIVKNVSDLYHQYRMRTVESLLASDQMTDDWESILMMGRDINPEMYRILREH